jgi:sugar lactone lactonase YvrE
MHTTIVTQKGELWVSDRQMHVIKVFDTSLNPLREIPEPTLISGLFQDAKGTIWASAGMDGMIEKLDADGKIVAWIGQRGRAADTPGQSPDAIGEAHFLAVTPDEQTIYLADSVNGKMVELKHN